MKDLAQLLAEAEDKRGVGDGFIQPLNERNVTDLTTMLDTSRQGWVGIVSEDHGGIIGYVHEDNLLAMQSILSNLLLNHWFGEVSS